MARFDFLFQVAQIVPCTEAEGPGRRFALWFQGCPLRCSGCCNPEMLSFEGGKALKPEQVFTQLKASLGREGIEGITLLGGEPLAHAPAAALLAREAQQLGLTVMVFSGYTLEKIRLLPNHAASDLLTHTDILVDGPFRRELPDGRRRWIGSTNQQIHFLTPRYRPDDSCWKLPNTLEIRLRGSELTLNGFPDPAATRLWKRIRP